MSVRRGDRLAHPVAESLAEFRFRHPERGDAVAQMLRLLEQGAPFSRESVDPGHFTASAFVLCPARQRVLLIHHDKLGRWLQPGGHVEPADASLMNAARREVAEETGARELVPLAQHVFDVDVHSIPARPTEGAHLHFDVRYAFVARDDRLEASTEVRAARWVPLAEVADLTSEESVLRCIRSLSSS